MLIFSGLIVGYHASVYCPNINENKPVCGLHVKTLSTREFKNKCYFLGENDYFYCLTQGNYLLLNEGKCQSSYTLSNITKIIGEATKNFTTPLVVGTIPQRFCTSNWNVIVNF